MGPKLVVKFLFLGILTLAAHNDPDLDPVRDQIYLYKLRTKNNKTHMTLTNGEPIYDQDTVSLNQNLIRNNFLIESLTGITRERIIARPVHGKGAGAFGYFEVTNNMSQYSKADFLRKVGERTPVAVRFSHSTIDTTDSDSIRGFRGFAVKFYTREGNLDLLGLNVPIFAFQDPIKFPHFTHSFERNPVTHIKDANMYWDFVSLNPESFFLVSKLHDDHGIPRGYRHMSGYCIHTFQIHNKFGGVYYTRFYFLPDAGDIGLTAEEAMELDGKDPDSFARDLYEAIACGKKVSWTLYMQVMTLEDAEKNDINIFDITREIPSDMFPLTEAGKLVLNRNPDNYFAEVEQLAFCPCHLIPGIDGGLDDLFAARMFTYRDSHNHRLGVNHNKIKVNCPFRTETHNYIRDGIPPVLANGGSGPNYYKNSFNGPEVNHDPNRPRLRSIMEKNSSNADQICQSYHDFSEDEKERYITNIVNGLGPAVGLVHENVLKMLQKICPDIGERVKDGLENFKKEPACNIPFD